MRASKRNVVLAATGQGDGRAMNIGISRIVTRFFVGGGGAGGWRGVAVRRRNIVYRMIFAVLCALYASPLTWRSARCVHILSAASPARAADISTGKAWRAR